VKELANNHQDKKGFWRKARRATAIAGAMIALTACEQQSQITDGTVFQKEYTKIYYGNDFGKVAHSRQEIEKEVVSTPPIYEEKGTDKATMSRLLQYHYEN
jgi:hypothetical protein